MCTAEETVRMWVGEAILSTTVKVEVREGEEKRKGEEKKGKGKREKGKGKRKRCGEYGVPAEAGWRGIYI